ncbi:gyrI-like small molecule binding domain protein [Clostridium sporogenes]|uniref:GyrI-like small molecule binding domain protein n=1 Tax=Clostridium sporogenes TaxID=1509 RepID=A0A1L3NHV9_CLOSG|nr:GyrI-like domain-containing protein [Clostridium sporogenes]APH15712.1 gyrI-like small molecule binding domain protein [Clostridium sporogenes]
MKHEWRKHEKQLYAPKEIPQLISVPKQKFFMIKGKGNPNDEDFSERIGVLYSLSYAVRMMPKNGFVPDGYFEYTVYPLEGIWEACDTSDKSTFSYTIMMRQPDFITEEVVNKAFEIANVKKPNSLLKEAYYGEIEEGLSVQVLHIGDYDDEPESFEKIIEFMNENNLQKRGETHREIYLSDARKVERNKLKTILRYKVKN